MKTRLLGAAVLVALAVLFVPMFFSSSPPSSSADESVSLSIPPAPDRDLQTKTMSLTPGAATASTAAPAPKPAVDVSKTPAVPSATPPGSDQLATVNIGSGRPRDVETDPLAGQKPEPTTVTKGGSTVTQPLIPAQTTPTASTAKPAKAGATSAVPTQADPLPATAAATAAHGQYSVNLSAYASPASAQGLIQRVHALGYPVSGRAITQAGKQLTMVTAGPFESRAAAESARLKITQTIPGAPARLESSASTPTQDDMPAAKPVSATNTAAVSSASGAGGWAVQVAAMGSQADANALRDKLRANGFDGYVDTVNASGKQLWRVRAGPQTQRADAVRIRDQIKTKLGVDGNVVSAP